MARVRFIKAAQRLGFRLDEIAGLLSLDDGTHCRETRTLGQRKLDDVREKMADLRRIESVLARLVRECDKARGTVDRSAPTALSVLGVGASLRGHRRFGRRMAAPVAGQRLEEAEPRWLS